VKVRRCSIIGVPSRFGQGIDISFSMDMPASTVDSCTIVGGQDGIDTHASMVDLKDNTVLNTTMHAISVGEMSMGMIDRNRVGNALGIGIYCGDHSECEIEHNVVSGTRSDAGSADPLRQGVGILAYYGSTAELLDNSLVASPGGISSTPDASIVHR
jgi:hypothetical protein